MTQPTHPPAKNPDHAAPSAGAYPPQDSPTPATPAGPHAAANDAEEVYYAGSPLLRGELGRGALWILIGLMFLAGPIVYFAITKNNVLPNGWVTLACVVLGLLFIAMPYLRAKSIRYRITNYRIDVTRGLLTTSIDTVELWHVEDLRYHQSIINKLVGIGDITIISKHPTVPVLQMRSLPHSRKLFTELEQRIISVKRLSSVVKVDPGT
jgi:membrane protein YdbS with pleckstrin-like domain